MHSCATSNTTASNNEEKKNYVSLQAPPKLPNSKTTILFLCLEFAVGELLASFISRVLILILPVVDYFSASVEQKDLLAVTDPSFGLKSSLEFFPCILPGPEKVFSHRAAMATTEYLVNCNSDILIQPKEV